MAYPGCVINVYWTLICTNASTGGHRVIEFPEKEEKGVKNRVVNKMDPNPLVSVPVQIQPCFLNCCA